MAENKIKISPRAGGPVEIHEMVMNVSPVWDLEMDYVSFVRAIPEVRNVSLDRGTWAEDGNGVSVLVRVNVGRRLTDVGGSHIWNCCE